MFALPTTHTPPSTSGIPEYKPSLDHHRHPQACPPGTVCLCLCKYSEGLLHGPHLNTHLGMQLSMALLWSHQACGEQRRTPEYCGNPLWVLIPPKPRPTVLGQILGPRITETCVSHAFSVILLGSPFLVPCPLGPTLGPPNPRVAGQVRDNHPMTLASLASSEPRYGFWNARGSRTQTDVMEKELGAGLRTTEV